VVGKIDSLKVMVLIIGRSKGMMALPQKKAKTLYSRYGMYQAFFHHPVWILGTPIPILSTLKTIFPSFSKGNIDQSKQPPPPRSAFALLLAGMLAKPGLA